MSTNTTSMSDSPTPGMPATPVSAEVVGKPEAADLPAVGSLPDPALIAKLANEYFAALLSHPAPPNVGPISLPGATVSAPGAVSGSTPPPTAQGATRALPPRTAEAAAFVLENPAAIPAQGAPGSPATLLLGATPVPINSEPSFPDDLFLMPGVLEIKQPPAVPAAPTSLQVEASSQELPLVPSTGVWPQAAEQPKGPEPWPAPNSPDDFTEKGKASPWDAPVSFPATAEWYSFSAVPGAQPLESPGFFSTLLSPTADRLTEADLRALPATLADATAVAPQALSGAVLQPPTSDLSNGLAGETTSPMNSHLSFPRTSDLFSLPGVPGVQAPPGVPSLPSSPPDRREVESARGAFSVPLPGSGVAPPARLDSHLPAGPATSGTSGQSEQPEFHPTMIRGVDTSKQPFDPHFIRRDFPILQEKVHGRPLIWLDNAATTQKPSAVIDRLSDFYRHENSNVHRAAHTLAARATDAYESAREKVRRFLNASSTREIVFVRGTTEGINLVAKSWGHRYVEKDDEVVITWLEHHANIVPWQQLCAEKEARLRVAPVDDRGQIILDEYERLLGPRTRMVAFSHVSNALGTVTPAREIIEMAHRHGARVLVDGAQSVAHMREDVQALDCDFFVFSGHKIFGPTGIGVVYGKEDILAHTPPWQGGGSMILDVTFERTVYNVPPARFEAGTGNIADAVGLGAALDYLSELGLENVARHEHALLAYATAGLANVPGLRIIGTAREKAGVISFVLDGVRTEDVGVALNQEGIAVRAGHHCAQPILRRFGVEGTVRPSFALYNTTEDIDALVAVLLRIQADRGRLQP